MAQGQAKSATFLLRQIRENKLDAKRLTTHQRRLCIRYLLEEEPGTSEYAMAELLGTSRSAVNRYKNQIVEQDGWIVDKLDVRLYATNLIRRYNIWIVKLEQKRLWDKAASLLKDLTDLLMELGVLRRAPMPINMSAEGQITLQEIVKRAVGHRNETSRVLGGNSQGSER